MDTCISSAGGDEDDADAGGGEGLTAGSTPPGERCGNSMRDESLILCVTEFASMNTYFPAAVVIATVAHRSEIRWE